MSYEAAFEALKDGDFNAAVPLLEQAAIETNYASDPINHAYTLALYRSGQRRRLAEVACGVGHLLTESDPGSAMDYFQRAFLGELDEREIHSIQQAFQGWAVTRDTAPSGLLGPIRRVAHVTGALLVGHPVTNYLKLLTRSLRGEQIESQVFTTEPSASWFCNPLGAPQTNAPDAVEGAVIASVEGDFVERAARIADAIRASGAQAAFYHADLSEQITSRVAALHPAPVQVLVDHEGNAVPAVPFEGYVHVSWGGFLQDSSSTAPREWIPPASDIEDRLQALEQSSRQAMGLESATTISATFGDLSLSAGAGYLRTLAGILGRFPKHFHLFVGAGDVKAIRAFLHAEGVLPRVRFLGQMSDAAPVLHVIDVYLASFPQTSETALVEVMGAGKPVVALHYPPDTPHSAAARLIANPDLVAATEAQYFEFADRMIRNVGARAKAADALRERFRAELHPSGLGARYLRFLERLVGAVQP